MLHLSLPGQGCSPTDHALGGAFELPAAEVCYVIPLSVSIDVIGQTVDVIFTWPNRPNSPADTVYGCSRRVVVSPSPYFLFSNIIQPQPEMYPSTCIHFFSYKLIQILHQLFSILHLLSKLKCSQNQNVFTVSVLFHLL